MPAIACGRSAKRSFWIFWNHKVLENTKPEILNTKQTPMPQITNSKRFDLEDWCLEFAKQVNKYVRSLPGSISNFENGKQLVRSAGSVGANYIEANESLSKKDFIMRAKISKKECKESRFWLYLSEPSVEQVSEKTKLVQEANEIMKILGSILEKCK